MPEHEKVFINPDEADQMDFSPLQELGLAVGERGNNLTEQQLVEILEKDPIFEVLAAKKRPVREIIDDAVRQGYLYKNSVTDTYSQILPPLEL